MGKFERGGDEEGGSPSPGAATKTPTVTSKMGSVGGSLREMLKMPEYHKGSFGSFGLKCRMKSENTSKIVNVV